MYFRNRYYFKEGLVLTFETHEIETIYDLMRTHAPWRGPYPMNDPEFMCAWLNQTMLLDSQSNLSKETLEAWWKSTEEYQNEWPKWEESQKPQPEPEPPPDPTDPDDSLPTPDPNFVGIQGQFRIDDAGYCDDVKRINPVGIHLGDIFSKFTRDPVHAERLIIESRNAGYILIHFWMNLGTLGDYWVGRECGPGFTYDFWGQLGKFGDLLDKYGMKGGYNLGDYELWEGNHADFFRELGRHLRDRKNQTAAYVFGGNEAWQTGASSKEEISDALDEFKAECNTVPVTTTSPPSEHTNDINAWCAGDFYAIHGYRGGEDHDRLRHIFSVNWEGKPPSKYGYQDEWTGPGSEVSVKADHCYHGRDVDSNHMCAGAIQSLLSNQGFNYFCSEGVKSDSIDKLKQRAGFNEVGKVSKIIPIDVMAWPGPFHFGSSQSDKRVFSPVKGDTLRFDHRISHDGRIFGIFYSDQGDTTARCERACYLSIVNWNGTVEPEEQFDLGEEIHFTWVRSQNGQPGHTACAVIGRLR